ncbi:WYL domain-containing protein [Mycobacterium sp. 1274756.6]|uniref:helix-turn-helix transcriptional regulator n=1 Tax=Mycobacterium sp. 1274756.6 TaxID=1834076 RepID=UPI0007FD0FF5|nr:WYL domain-containing protein [Mycobacterium sp. 1274756.6]OBJ73647.1 WYL domain-containing protein [Mycobacterium sp. 1274756.6]
MAESKVERLLNLVIALLSTRGYLTAEKIRATVVGYDNSSDDAFARMFERDKSELRDLGIPLETGKASSSSPVEGYRISADDYALPEITLTAGEAAAVAVAGQLWETPELITATQRALLKLRAAGVDVDPDASTAIAPVTERPGLRGAGTVLAGLLAAIDHGQAVQFEHRPSRSQPYTLRTVEPWGVLTAKGRWYLVGHDRDRDDTRVFRLSRMGDTVTPIGAPGAVSRTADVDLRQLLTDVVAGSATTTTARVWVAEDRGVALRRTGTAVEQRRLGERDGTVFELPADALGQLTRTVAGYGADAVVLEPAELREDVLARLRALASDDVEVSG